MSFLNSALLFGLGLTAVPVVLHFLMRQKPKKLPFPALRLVRRRQRQSVRRLRLRHVWLMLLRMLVLGGLIFALSRPSVPPANYSLTGREWAVLLAIAAAGIGIYTWLLARARRRTSSQFQFQQQQRSLRNRTTLATLAALLLLVGLPYQQRIAAEITGPAPAVAPQLPVAGVMLFDSSLSMSYLQSGETVLDRAQAIAISHLESLPPGSRMAVADTAADRPIPFQSTLRSTRTRIAALDTQPASLPLEDRIREALRAQEEDRQRTLGDLSEAAGDANKDRYIRRIYVFTDLARSAWRTAGSSLLKSDLERLKYVNLYVIDVGREDAHNRAITEVSLSSDRIPVGGDLAVSATLQSQGESSDDELVELLFQASDGKLIKQGQSDVALAADQPQRIEFPLISGLTQHFTHGLTRLVSTDPLTFDNLRFFTVEVSPPPPVLVIAPQKSMTEEWVTALAPYDRLNASLNKYAPHYEPPSRIQDITLDNYPMIALLNCTRLSDDDWFQLGQYVKEGGGLFVALGSDDISAPSYNRAQAQQFLPGWLDAWQPEQEWSITIDEPTHPLFAIYRRLESYGSFSMLENLVYVTRFWKVRPAEGANVLATYNDAANSPAILVRNYGKGRVLMFTTAVTLPDNVNDRWNNFPSPLIDSWLFVTFVEQVTDYVSRFSDDVRSFLSGETVRVSLEPAEVERSFLLREPDLKQSRHTLDAGESTLVIENITTPGHYEVIADESGETVGAFSMNPRPEESDLTRLTAEDLNDRLGKERYQVARSLDELKDNINASDLGQEIFPVLLALVIALFCGEHLVANRFYDSTDDAVGRERSGV